MSPTANEALRRPIGDPISGHVFQSDELDHVHEDLDVDKFMLDLAHFKRGKADVRSAVTSAEVELSLEGAHELTLVVHDKHRDLYRSGILDRAVDMEVRGWWWRLARRAKNGDDITLTFEPRVVTWMRSETGRKKVRRGQVTRAEFVRSLVKSISKGNVKFVCPELHEKQPKEKTQGTASGKSRGKAQDETTRRKNRAPGLPNNYRIPGEHRGERFSAVQTSNAEKVLVTGYNMGARPKVLLMAMMTVYQESRFLTSATNSVGHGHFGLFQQDPQYWPATRDPEIDSRAFFKKMIVADRKNPNGGYNDVIQAVQGAGPGEQLWANWRNQAEDIVGAFFGGDYKIGGTVSVTVEKPYEFKVGKDEHYYGAAMRLTDDVAWRFWSVKDTFHYQSEASLFKSKSLMTITEGKDGIDWIDFDDDDRRPVTECAVTCRMKMWLAPVGTVVTVDDGGSADGNYLVSAIRRDYFSQDGTITLRKPTKPKPEPANETKTNSIGQAGGELSGSAVKGARAGYPTTQTTSVLPEHPTDGLPGFPAHDYMAPAGSPCVAPADGVVCKLSGHDPATGPPGGVHGPFGWSVYIWSSTTGKTYYLTHMGSRNVTVGNRVRQGQQIGTVGNYAKWGGANHIHMGVHVGHEC